MTRSSLCKMGIAIGLGNYLLYAVTTILSGGDALHGYIAQSHYYVAASGAFIEVSQTMFLVCKWQAYSLLLTFPLGLLGACFLTPPDHDQSDTELAGGNGNAGLSPHAP